MQQKYEENKATILNAVIAKIKKKMPADQSALCAEFVKQFYSIVSLEDLLEWNIEDLYGAAVNFWSLIQHRAPQQTKIRIYNPDFERHGWQTTHTVVEVVTDDMPFIVDSLRMVVNRMGLSCHLVIHTGGLCFQRGADHGIKKIFPPYSKKSKHMTVEAPVFMQIDRQTDAQILQDLHTNFDRVLQDNRAVVEDWEAMRKRIQAVVTELDVAAKFLDRAELDEAQAFLKWIVDHHFTLLAVRDYVLVDKNGDRVLQPVMDSGLGLMRPALRGKGSSKRIAAMTPEAKALLHSQRVLIMSKLSAEATVHRNALTDYIGVKRYNPQGEVIGECRIIGLYASPAYNASPTDIPLLRHKVAMVLKNSGLNPHSHAGKVLLNIIETLPRDDLIQASEEDLLHICLGIYHMQDRPKIRLFGRVDVYRRFVSCLVYVPKDRFNTELRQAMQNILAHTMSATRISFSTWFPESTLARIHFLVHINPENPADWDFKEIEQALIEVARSWGDDFKSYLFEAFGEEDANRLYARYKTAFPGSYSDTFSPRIAVFDIKHMENLSEAQPVVMNFYRPMDEMPDSFRLKIYQHRNTIALSDVLPVIEHLGMRAMSERPYLLSFEDGQSTWISDFAMQYTGEACFDIDAIKDLFQNAFLSVWFGDAENDGFNHLILSGGLDWREVAVLRAYAKYFKQIGFTFSQDYIEKALCAHPYIAKNLVTLFDYRFNPARTGDREALVRPVVDTLMKALDDVSNLDEDRILRQYVHVILATIRTNFYQYDAEGNYKTYISLKFESKKVPGLPKPHPLYEIFVYSPRFEAIHLRFGKVARGGLRWSDRGQDVRTEVLGLVKAQHVKNGQIVPGGAKGGFVPKQLPVSGAREAILNEGVACYKLFIRGLLDITDNYVSGDIRTPEHVVRYDGDDPYLVVAADKGTATFSDFANAISQEYGFWLGDAFASGGSVGYDHKKMGITARGAWESVKRHFLEMDHNVDTTDFTVIGIGDMSGDVFGNGMLLSQHIQLVAAFNHMHIFIDPTPDSEKSYEERLRLFQLPRSGWSDYDVNLISPGGGIFSRFAKSIRVTPEMKKALAIELDHIEPNELIRAILRAPVDLFWSAGIGTYVKDDSETHADVGDKTNDATRINASELRCRVVGEGGNLGFTQLARIQYELNDGLIFTDFIDNSGGVNCSDKEVNIKILLNIVVNHGDLTIKQRNELLASMTDAVAKLVLRDNFVQPRAISYSSVQSARSLQLYIRYLNELSQSGKIDRAIEYLPDEKTLMERKLNGKGLTRPEIAVLLCYSKILLKEGILATDVAEDAYLQRFLVTYFPEPLQQQYAHQMHAHPLKREIIATAISNIIVNEMGPIFVFRIQNETGMAIAAIVKAYIVTRTVLKFDNILQQMAILEPVLPLEDQTEIVMMFLRLLRRVTRWFLKNQRVSLNISTLVKRYGEGIDEIKRVVPAIYSDDNKKQYEHAFNQYIAMGIEQHMAHELAVTPALFSATDIVDVARKTGVSIKKTAQLYSQIGEYLDLNWFRSQVIAHGVENNWDSMSREAIRDDMDWQQRQLTEAVIKLDTGTKTYSEAFQTWKQMHERLILRWQDVITELRASPSLNYTMFFVAVRELLDLTQTAIQVVEKEVVMEK